MALGYSSVSYRIWELGSSVREGLEALWNFLFSCVTISVLDVNGKGFNVIYNLCWVVLLVGGEICNSSIAL